MNAPALVPWFFDTEGFLIQPGQAAPRPVCLQSTLNPKEESNLFHLNPRISREGWDEFERRLSDPQTLFVGHNVAYDMASLCAERPEYMKAIFRAYQDNRTADTMDRQKLIDIAMGQGEWMTVHGERVKTVYDLATTASRHAPILLDKSDPWRKRYGELWNVDPRDWPKEALAYALLDPRGTAWAFLGQEQYAPLLVDQHRQARAAWWLHLMGAWGVRTDFETVKAAEAEVLAEVVRDREHLVSLGLVRRDGSRDTKLARQMMLAAYDRLGEAAHITDGGLKKIGTKYSTDVPPERIMEFLRQNPDCVSLDDDACSASNDEVMQAYGRFGSANTLLKKVRRLYKGAGATPLQASFVTLMDTGRTSCRQAVKDRGKEEAVPPLWGTQLQNPPREGPVRECIIARPGFLFADSDYSGMELCTWSQVCIWALGYSRMAEAINAGKDPHSMVASTILGKPYEWCIDAKEGALGEAAKKALDDARQSGKIANFGWPGGMGPATLRVQARTQYGVDMSLEDCKRLKETWLRTWPEGADYFKWINKMFAKRGEKATIIHFLSKRVRGNIPYTVACNSFFQGLAADAAKAAGFEISRECYTEEGSDLYGSRPCIFVHDQFIAEVPEWKASRAALRMDTIMRTEAQKWIPDVRITSEPTLTRRWYKGGKPVWNESKTELLEWKPKPKAA